MAMAELPGPYDVRAYACVARGVLTNTCPMAPYRGVSRPVITTALERLMDAAAAEFGMEPVEIRRRNLIETVLPTLLVGMTMACAVLYVFTKYSTVMIDVGGQGSPQQIFFGTEYRARDLTRFVVPLEAVAGVFFVLVALAFVGLGQVMGRAFTALPNRIVAYTVNIAGSLAGIAGFAIVCYLRAPPSVWFAIACALTLHFLPRWTLPQICLPIAVLVVLALAANAMPISQTTWSPYYKILYYPASRLIATNNIGHQVMVNIDESGPAYTLRPIRAALLAA
jgi:hypothetical protein